MNDPFTTRPPITDPETVAAWRTYDQSCSRRPVRRTAERVLPRTVRRPRRGPHLPALPPQNPLERRPVPKVQEGGGWAMSTDLFGADHAPRSAMGSHQSASGGADEWLTPPDLIEAIGPFDLDPCASIDRPWDTARRHYTILDDGIHRPWEGRVWLNPPYSRADAWLARLAGHGHGTALIFARTETRLWFDHVWPKATGLLFLRGRLHFHYRDGRRAPANSGAPSVLIAYGEADADILAGIPVPGHFVRLGGVT